MYCEKYVELTCHDGAAKLLVKIGKYSVSKRKDLNWSCNYLLKVTITYQAKHVTDIKFGSRVE